ncbi:MAG: hypothetical protein RQ745_06505 [Longimicrobiales bacterium]|nr:hypothetical protein [Longimicrobiales bacterium]
MPHPPAVGDAAPRFDLATLEGDRLRLSELRGRPVIVSFLRHAG